MLRRSLLRDAAALPIATVGAPAFAKCPARIVLGQSAALTRPAAALGVQFRIGAMLQFDTVNARGGINGRARASPSPRARPLTATASNPTTAASRTTSPPPGSKAFAVPAPWEAATRI